METQSHNIVVSARGWLVVDPLGVTKPTVGWKRTPLSAVMSHLVFLISVYILYLELNILDACSCLYAHKWFMYRSVCLVFWSEIMDACLYLYDHNRFMYRINKFRLWVRSLEICSIYLTCVVSWLDFPKAPPPRKFPRIPEPKWVPWKDYCFSKPMSLLYP